MTGVTIIDVIKIYDIANWQMVLCFIPFLLSAVISLVIMFKATKGYEPWEPAPFPVKVFMPTIAIGALITICSMLYADKCCPAELVETQYEVRIEGTASFKEVYEKYNIIKEKEGTFIVTEKE